MGDFEELNEEKCTLEAKLLKLEKTKEEKLTIAKANLEDSINEKSF